MVCAIPSGIRTQFTMFADSAAVACFYTSFSYQVQKSKSVRNYYRSAPYVSVSIHNRHQDVLNAP